MPRVSLAGFRDPARRPRYIAWSGAAVLAILAFTITALGVTSTRWFCSSVCHKVQDDTIIAYESSSHARVSCMACHMPVGADPVTFILHKVKALGEAYLTVTNTFELPLNEGSHLALSEHMAHEQCTQCHNLANRRITPAKGILIDHAIHEENDVACSWCHNRVAHPEDFELTLEGNEKHVDFMGMTACFRCHGLDPESEAPGECAACHTPGFELKPASHAEPGFYEEFGESSGHAQLAREEVSRTVAIDGAEDAAASDESDESDKSEESDGEDAGHTLPAVDEINACSTCHLLEDFCVGCHGVEMPHPVDFEEGHGEVGRSSPEVCSRCHGTELSTSTEFCNGCHHSEGDPTKPWIPQHFQVVFQTGARGCFECHNPTYCAECHVRGQ